MHVLISHLSVQITNESNDPDLIMQNANGDESGTNCAIFEWVAHFHSTLSFTLCINILCDLVADHNT